MINVVLLNRICKIIAITYALREQLVIDCYERIGSIDKVMEMAKNNEIK